MDLWVWFGVRMYSLEDKQLALALYAELGDERDVVEVFGFPHPLVLKRWIKRGDTPASALSFAEFYERYQRGSQVEVRKKHCVYGQDVKDRARVLFEEGHSFQTIATMLGVSSRQVVQRWIHPNRKEEPMTGRKSANPTPLLRAPQATTRQTRHRKQHRIQPLPLAHAPGPG